MDHNGHTPGGVHGFSARIAAQKYYEALTAPDPTSRLAAESLMWQSLGHVAHHIEDMAQPQHVRNEPHLHGTGVFGPLPGYREFPPGISRYEVFTVNRPDSDITALVNDPANRYAGLGPEFPTMRGYFQMGQFTSTNFTTMSSEFSIVPTGTGYGPNPAFPLPDGSKVTGVTAVTAPDTFLGFHYKAYYVSEVMNDTFGGGTNLTIKMARACNLFQMFRAQTGDTKATCLVPDDSVYADWNRVLLPRSVAFVQGMIDHFFRGRLSLTAVANANGVVDGTAWKIQDKSRNQLSGKFELYAEDSNGQRSLVWSLVQGIAQNGYFNVTLPTSPAPAPKLVAVFSGMVGNEGSQNGSSSYYQVEGAVATVPNPPPPPPPPPPASCTKTFGSTGTANFDTTWSPGSAGTVDVQFEAYSVPDSLTLTQSGKNVVATPGLVSGFTEWHFENDGTPVKIHVGANQTYQTQWDLTLACGSLTPPSQIKRTQITILLRNDTCIPTAGWQVAIDGVPLNSVTGSQWTTTVSNGPAHSVTTRTTPSSCDPGVGTPRGPGEVYFTVGHGQVIVGPNQTVLFDAN